MEETAYSPWAVLGLDEGATLGEVRHAFRALAKKTHPDRGGSRAEFEALHAAFVALQPIAPSDPDRGPVRRPHPRHQPTSSPRVTPAPAHVTSAYEWPGRARRSTTVVIDEPRPRPSRRLARRVPTADAFAAVLHAEFARAGIAA